MEPTKKFQRYRPINDIVRTIFVFGLMIMGKEPLEELKFAIFKNWLDTRPKMEMHDPNVYPTILRGVSRGFWSPFLDLGALSAIFWHLKTGTFARDATASKNYILLTCGNILISYRLYSSGNITESLTKSDGLI